MITLMISLVSLSPSRSSKDITQLFTFDIKPTLIVNTMPLLCLDLSFVSPAGQKRLAAGQRSGEVAVFETNCLLKHYSTQSAALAGSPRSVCRIGVWPPLLRHLPLLLDL